MSDQEMQFADPAWRPPQQGGVETDTQQQEPYLPLNSDAFEQAQQQDEPYANTASYAEGYRAQPPGGMPSISNIPLRTRQRRGRSPWLWFILALVIFSLVSGAFTMNASRERGFPGYSSFPKTDFFRHDHFQPSPQQFNVGVHPTLVINDPFGSVTVNTGGPDDSVAVQTDQTGSKLLNIQRGSGDTLTITVNNADPSAEVNLDVTVASEADVEVTTGSGDINVSGVNGQVNLQSDSGGINLSQVSLFRNSVAKTNSGDITFDGVIDPNGTYQFQSRSGSVDVTLPSASSFHTDITTTIGSIDSSDFPEVSVSSDGTSAHGDVGSPPRAKVTINTDSGSINLLHNGS